MPASWTVSAIPDLLSSLNTGPAILTFSCLSPPDMVKMSFSCVLASLASTRLPGDLAQSDLLVSHCLEVVSLASGCG